MTEGWRTSECRIVIFPKLIFMLSYHFSNHDHCAIKLKSASYNIFLKSLHTIAWSFSLSLSEINIFFHRQPLICRVIIFFVIISQNYLHLKCTVKNKKIFFFLKSIKTKFRCWLNARWESTEHTELNENTSEKKVLNIARSLLLAHTQSAAAPNFYIIFIMYIIAIQLRSDDERPWMWRFSLSLFSIHEFTALSYQNTSSWWRYIELLMWVQNKDDDFDFLKIRMHFQWIELINSREFVCGGVWTLNIKWDQMNGERNREWCVVHIHS